MHPAFTYKRINAARDREEFLRLRRGEKGQLKEGEANIPGDRALSFSFMETRLLLIRRSAFGVIKTNDTKHSRGHIDIPINAREKFIKRNGDEGGRRLVKVVKTYAIILATVPWESNEALSSFEYSMRDRSIGTTRLWL
ncbi:hypothetical protein BU15DRAFT_66116 [Melanogaster broomeanus]|nr:hypothetical protein BU15DRAFT_66116 [Melanogaster broomeanus]